MNILLLGDLDVVGVAGLGVLVFCSKSPWNMEGLNSVTSGDWPIPPAAWPLLVLGKLLAASFCC